MGFYAFNMLTHSSLGDREDEFVTYLIITIESKVVSSPTLVIYLRGYVSEVVVPSYFVSCFM